MLDLSKIAGFEWDEGNIQKNWLKHSVYSKECEEIFTNAPLLLLHDTKHSRNEKRFFGLGHTNTNRLLFIVFTLRNRRIRVISARTMNKKEQTIYEQTKKI